MGVIRYVGTGKKLAALKVSVSMNNGRSWQVRDLAPGQSFAIPASATNLLLDNVPYDPKGNYEIRDGRIASR